MDKEVVLYWSSGKDCTMVLYQINTDQRYTGYRVTSLLSTVTEGFDRVSGHGVRRSVLERQAACLGLDLHKAYISQKSSMDEYESVMVAGLLERKKEGTQVVATGDIYIEKLRMATFRKLGMRGCFPLVRKDTYEHVRSFIALGFKAYVVCVDSTLLDQSFLGRIIDDDFINQLPAGVDPCGENGEFHTFVFDGPMFKEQVKCKLGEVVLRDGFYFRDIVLDN